LFSKQQEQTMTPKPATQPKSGGLRGRDKQQDTLRDQDSGQGIVRNERGEDQPKDKARAQQDSGAAHAKRSRAAAAAVARPAGRR